MNQDQRKFLIEKVRSGADKEIEELKEGLPAEPNLNNYLVSAFLAGKIEFVPIAQLRDRMRDAILKCGSTVEIIAEDYDDDNMWGKAKRRSSKRKRYQHDDGDSNFVVKIPPEELFVLPPAFLKERAEWEAERDRVEAKIKEITTMRDTVIMKIQIGSSARLDSLIMEVDSMGDLSILNAQLQLTGSAAQSAPPKQLSGKKGK